MDDGHTYEWAASVWHLSTEFGVNNLSLAPPSQIYNAAKQSIIVVKLLSFGSKYNSLACATACRASSISKVAA